MKIPKILIGSTYRGAMTIWNDSSCCIKKAFKYTEVGIKNYVTERARSGVSKNARQIHIFVKMRTKNCNTNILLACIINIYVDFEKRLTWSFKGMIKYIGPPCMTFLNIYMNVDLIRGQWMSDVCKLIMRPVLLRTSSYDFIHRSFRTTFHKLHLDISFRRWQ